jgi:hypothetical protein
MYISDMKGDKTEEVPDQPAVEPTAQPEGEPVEKKGSKLWIWLVAAVAVIGLGVASYFMFF